MDGFTTIIAFQPFRQSSKRRKYGWLILLLWLLLLSLACQPFCLHRLRPGKFSENHLVNFKVSVFSLYLFSYCYGPSRTSRWSVHMSLDRSGSCYVVMQCHLVRVALGWGFSSCALFFVMRYSYFSVFMHGTNSNEKKPPSVYSMLNKCWLLRQCYLVSGR